MCRLFAMTSLDYQLQPMARKINVLHPYVEVSKSYGIWKFEGMVVCRAVTSLEQNRCIKLIAKDKI